MKARLVFSIVLLAFLISANRAHAKAASAIPITTCETISQPGKYVLENNLVIKVADPSQEGGDCLVIGSSHVTIDFNGWGITAVCVPYSCPPDEYGPVGGTGIIVGNGVDHVMVSNVEVQNFVNGIVVDADRVSVMGANLEVVTGIILNNASHGKYFNVSYQPGDQRYHSNNGPIIAVNGGSHNNFETITGVAGGGWAPEVDILVANSNHNTIDGADVISAAEQESGPGIQITQDSSHNDITNSNVYVLYGNGIEVDLGSNYNTLEGNTVSIIAPPGYYDLVDDNPNCGRDVWNNNFFTSANPGCIH